MHSVTPPTIITPWGAVTPGILIDAIGGNAPVLPENAEKIEKIYDRIRPENYALPPLKPTGQKNRISLPRPEIGESQFPKELHVVPPPKPIRIPESYVEPPTYVTPKPQAAYPVLPSPPPGYLPAVPKPFYDQLQEEEYPAGYYRSRSPKQRQTTAQSRQASKPLKYTPPQNNANR
jgi:hypothetical protein